MINDYNPWKNMNNSTQRRVHSKVPHNIFWVTDIKGNYGLCLQTRNISTIEKDTINLKGISIVKTDTSDGYTNLYLILNKKEDRQIFYVLCSDLISITQQYESDEIMISMVEIRLKRWQMLLRSERKQEMGIEKQMGLFSELLCLKEIVCKKVGTKQAIISWVGPDFDKQDFLLSDRVIEVKSHRTSKGEIVNISSLEQLYSEKDLFYLISYSLTPTEDGDSVEDLTEDIRKILKYESMQIQELFENKLLDYGYIPEILKGPSQKFIVDNKKAFIISESFPKISRSDVKGQIKTVNYSIDLSKCKEFEVNLDNW